MTRQHTRVIAWTVAVVLAVVFSKLGFWQLQRMQHKELLLAQATHVRDHTLSVAQALQAPPMLRWINDHGRFLAGTVLLDNQLRGGRSGVKVYQAFQPAQVSAPLLVDLGWLPLPADRKMPTITPLSGEYEVQGLLAPAPSAGIALGPALVDTPQSQVWLATRLDAEAIGTRLGLPAHGLPEQVLRLDPTIRLGYERDLDLLPNTIPPSRHLGYAVQWFAMALTVLLIGVVLEWRARRRNGR